ncbi:hypothetical protein EMIHUDRAFT_242932 [Emiliania huxleyi CCMP1516]|uniref:Inositol polyphosphate-related phosphatase domain-containing protein n=2 Tax=Emiliania huxleyi TaxID=2903 RepID=A0A0D3J787_EMIH1|nr:hypothetical protein EMIHUDRAFT_242932 [Emiliania huxleyi CCMP1516]EOD19372.1 hypothetical protein EMIHUDRAFT_242932 [Emiliania huxleyi CCMP1516]|eukprot:XP_005771801.1 hypothetical protein EMIHUDRAFT_242932 [Emiliania huxleyi CCMP1516]
MEHQTPSVSPGNFRKRKGLSAVSQDCYSVHPRRAPKKGIALALPLTIRCLTWNVGNAKPVAAELAHALPDGLDEDIIVVGTQENSYKAGKGGRKRAVAQEKRAVAQESPEPTEKAGSAYSAYEPAPTPGSPHSSVGDTEEREEESAAAVGGGGKGHAEWEEMLARRLGRGYVPVRHVRLWEMRLSVYVKASQRANVTKVHVASAATGGPGGMLGNKGGLVVRLRLGATSLAFVSCHLAAHSHMLSRRNHNCSELLRETASALGPRHLTAAAQFDHVLRLVEQGDWGALLGADQLAASRAAGEAFVGFEEGPIAFAPTFKVERSSELVYQQKRIPSYCDRVLWKSAAGLRGAVSQTSLAALPRVSTSDHKPVVATFSLTPSEALRGTMQEVRSGGSRGSRGSSRKSSLFGNVSSSFAAGSASFTGSRAYASLDVVRPTLLYCAAHEHVLKKGEAAASTVKHGQDCTWPDDEVPLLRLRGVRTAALPHTTLLLAVLDKDNVILGKDDPVGVVQVPLRPVGWSQDSDLPPSFEVEFDEPLVQGMASTDLKSGRPLGRLRGTLSIATTAEAIEEALAEARADGAGEKARTVKLGASAFERRWRCC